MSVLPSVISLHFTSELVSARVFTSKNFSTNEKSFLKLVTNFATFEAAQ
jgi:hypothetical protein